MSTAVQNFNSAAQITKSDSLAIWQQVGKPNDRTSFSLYVGTAGDLVVITIKGYTVEFPNHPVGYVPGEIKQVLSTGTAASDFVALWNE